VVRTNFPLELNMKPYSKIAQPVAIVLADKPLTNDLETIFGRQELSSLMIAGNTVIEHVLMELQDLKVQECIVLARENASQIQTLIGDTRRWGINITVMNYSLTKDQVLREYKSLSSPNGLLIVEVDRLRSRCIKLFLDQATLSDYSLLEAQSAKHPLGITLLKANDSDFIINAIPIGLNDVVVNPLRTTRDFHQANFDVVASNFPGLEPSVHINSTIGQRQHWASHVHTQPNHYSADMMIERHCMVGKDVSLKSVILNHDVYVEKNAHIENTIVMPHAIISAQRPIKNAIINEDMIYQL